MTEFLIYLCKTSVCLIVFYLFFRALLTNETFFRFNRGILIFGTMACFVIPAVIIPVSKPSVLQTPIIMLEESLNEHSIISQENIIPENTSMTVSEAKEKTFSADPVIILTLIFFTGLIISLIFLLKSFFSMYTIIVRSPRKEYKGHKLIVPDSYVSPFSWNKYIVISNEDLINNPDEIITHEIAHIENNHSFDILLFELFVLFQWFNPAIWLLKKELKDVHEYQADSSVLKNGIDATRYQLLLVKKAVGSNYYTLANSFNHSKIKKRITMMLKEKSKNRAKWKLILLLPALCIMLIAFAKPSKLAVISHLTSSEVSEKSEDPEKYSKEYFEKESDAFVKQIVGDKKLSKEELKNLLEKETNYLNFIISDKHKNLWYMYSYVKNESDEKITIVASTPVEKLSELLFSQKPTGNKPVFMNIKYESGINEADFNKIMAEVKKAFLNNENVTDRKVYVYFDAVEKL